MYRVAVYAPYGFAQDPSVQLKTCESVVESALGPDVTITRYTHQLIQDVEHLFQDDAEGNDFQEFECFRNTIIEGDADYVVIDTFDRLDAIQREMSLEQFLQLCFKNGIAILSPEAEISISPKSTTGEEMAEAIGTQIARWLGQSHIDSEERSELIQEGIAEAKESQKWVGRPPIGFEIDAQGRLSVNHEEFKRVYDAIQDAESGASIRDAAANHDLSHSTLQKVVADEQRKALYTQGTDAGSERDQRVVNALRQYEAATKAPYD